METIRAYFPNATLDTVPDAGHWVHADHPAAFARAVRRFLGVPDQAPDGEGS
jgi:pimeloyl-ACP methyl ester carboxylesterase